MNPLHHTSEGNPAQIISLPRATPPPSFPGGTKIPTRSAYDHQCSLQPLNNSHMVTKVHHIDSLPTSHSELQNPTLVHSKPHPPHTLPTTTTNLITQRKQTIEISNTAGLFTKMSTRLQPKQTLSSTDIPHWGSNSGESVTTPDELHPATPPPREQSLFG
jgi:hypothetical protein